MIQILLLIFILVLLTTPWLVMRQIMMEMIPKDIMLTMIMAVSMGMIMLMMMMIMI